MNKAGKSSMMKFIQEEYGDAPQEEGVGGNRKEGPDAEELHRYGKKEKDKENGNGNDKGDFFPTLFTILLL